MMNAVDRLQEDEMARSRALEIASFIVEAPAGAGKTELLTQRYLRLLAVVEHPEEVLALTFTNKAATEMRDRILGNLTLAAAGEMPAAPHKQLTFRLAQQVLAQDQARGWRLLGHPGRLRITTLDALCASLARQMPYLSRFGAQPGVAEDAEAHYVTAVRRTLEMVESGGADADVVAEALSFMDNNAGRLEKLLVSMLNCRDQWLHHATRIENGEMQAEVVAGFAALVERDLQHVAQLIDTFWQGRLMPLARFAAANVPEVLPALLDWHAPLTADIADLPRWQALSALLLTGTGTLRKALNKNIGFPADKPFAAQKAAMTELLADLSALPALEERLAVISTLPHPELSPAEWSTVECFSRLLRLAAGQLWLAFQEAGEVDFIEIAARARMALGEDEAPTDLAQALDYRIRHLLVDEFQDTSPVQVTLIEKLTRGWMPDDGRTLFVVGDPMQSIYRFRKADVGLFLRVRSAGIGDIRLENLRLCRNNRSFPGVVDWVNTVFPEVFPAQDGPEVGAVRYAESVATKSSTAECGVVIHPVFAGEAGDAAADEASCVLEIIRRTQAARPDERIAVLVRARSHLDALVAEIRRTAPALRFQAVDIEGLDGRQPVQDLLTLQYALWHRADRVHWLALLRAPWCGLTLADLHALAADEREHTVWQLLNDAQRLQRLSEDGQRRVAHVRGVLALAFAERGRQHPRRWLESVWLMLGGPATLPTAADLEDVTAFFRLMDQLVAAQQLNAESLAAGVLKLFAPPDSLAGDSVQMMTIHKAKGLEFETVILPGLHRETGAQESPLLLWDQVPDAKGHEHLLVAPLRAKGHKEIGGTAFDYLKRIENERAAHETARLLYVAATRAIRHLHLVGVVSLDAAKDDGMKPPAAASLLKLLWQPLAQKTYVEALPEARTPRAAPGENASTFSPPLIRLAYPQVPEWLRSTPERLPNQEDAEAPDEWPDIGRSLEASVGTLVHRCLELIAREGVAAWTVQRIDSLEAVYQRLLRVQGYAAVQAGQGAAEVLRALKTTLSSEAGRWVLAAHEAAGFEQAWSSRQGNVTVNHVIDRVFMVDGVRWIIDYKTVRLADEGRTALQRQAEAYRAQLARYAGLFANDAPPVRKAVFFPLQGELVELR